MRGCVAKKSVRPPRKQIGDQEIAAVRSDAEKREPAHCESVRLALEDNEVFELPSPYHGSFCFGEPYRERHLDLPNRSEETASPLAVPNGYSHSSEGRTQLKAKKA